MDMDKIRELAEIAAAYELTAVEVCEGDNKIRLEKSACAPVAGADMGAAAAGGSPAAQDTAAANAAASESVDFNRLIEVKSPLVGVFYSSASPDSEPFVSIGSKVKKGDVLCIVETMKLMNDIVAEQDGEIVDICVKNGDIAEFGQVLFKMF
ncbi:MAG: acetyl-CoA carboxylase biotin carboxyl carrier protein [Oscillospiraceae bacterium]|nr:acetyl-CoA carboxylase biotin carboxyl carrier protein [Oscillospiraceae bacterium]